MTVYCIDDRHGTPCAEPCVACPDDECDPTARVEAPDQLQAARIAGWSEDYIESVRTQMVPA